METTKRLVMTFANADGKKISISVQDPKDNLTEEEIKDTMDLIIAKNIFAPDGLDLVSSVEAKIVVTDTTPYDLVIG